MADRLNQRYLVGMSGGCFLEFGNMAIYRMIRESAFDPEGIERMTAAYEHAVKVLQLNDRNDELVARKIIEIAEVGERDPDRLSVRALETLGIGPNN